MVTLPTKSVQSRASGVLRMKEMRWRRRGNSSAHVVMAAVGPVAPMDSPLWAY